MHEQGSGRVLVVTGAGSGMGRVAVERGAGAYAVIVALDREEQALAELAAEPRAPDDTIVVTIACDVSDPETLRSSSSGSGRKAGRQTPS